ncbi:anaerobic glycerol-3-phosphate dehydrogenase subunit C [Desulfitobacterium sp.]|uniref:anaerobic glycerol-3-phosphate dehydrogenase subunit C n=1 Tax=Desulfitobacterium sp. TaxID=49981 RepID=UPI002C697CE2|nr:anaerobic glycerol-3-phosphate dehydrogenase subunit C [Desulfitobacterium sp.]HVJ47950.1 anaerobic glycerol-3-phosphate dehydrogenase subunit C [Desulfitobacterium sp.]
MEHLLKLEQERDLTLDDCIKCSACSAQCPVAAVYPLFPGPKSVGPDMERLRLEGVRLDTSILSFCSNCKTCEVTCPSDVKITEMILGARQAAVKAKNVSSRHKLRDAMLGRAEYLGILGTISPGLTNGILGISSVRWLMERSLGISQLAPLPKYQPRFKGLRKSSAVSGLTQSLKQEPPSRKRVVYFPGCFINYNDPQTGEAVVKVLEHNGYEVILPPFHCCGVPLQANGNFKGAEDNAKKNLALLAPYLQEGLPVVASCTSCGLALREEYPHVKAEGAERIGLQTYDLFEFLWELHKRGELQEDFHEVPRSLGYHPPCHLKAQGIGTPSVRLLRLIPGVTIDDLDAGCCGLSGSFEFKEEKYPLAMQIGSHLFKRAQEGVAQGKFERLITECGGCKVQIEHGSGVKAEHPIWVMMEAYGLSDIRLSDK